MVCGAHAIYTALFHHAATNTYIRTGFDCADKMQMGDRGKFRAFRKAVHNARELQAGKHKAKALLTDAGLDRAWHVYDTDDDAGLLRIGAAWEYGPDDDKTVGLTTEAQTVCSIVGKLVRYGFISEKQEAYLHKLVDRIYGRREIEAKRQAEKDRADPCPTGRTTVEGEVIKTEWRESAYGGALKMTVKTPGGFPWT